MNSFELEIEGSDSEEEEQISPSLVSLERPSARSRRKISGILFSLAVLLGIYYISSNNRLRITVQETTREDSVTTTLLPDCHELDTGFFQKFQQTQKTEQHRCRDNNTSCHCPDPFVPSEYDEGENNHNGLWNRTRLRNKYLLQPYLHQVNVLDVLLVGDSLTEHWQGTHFSRISSPDANGHGRMHALKNVFTEYFGARGPHSVKGVALGVGHDGYSQLLYRILRDNELRGDSVVAPVIWITIGVYDILKRDCTPEAVLAGIMQVVQAIQSQRYQPTRIVLQSILPLNEQHAAVARHVNEFLYCYAAATPHVDFFDATALFETNQGQRNHALFQDAIHPNVEGYQLLGSAIVHRVKSILEEMKVDILDWNMADGPV